jgi:hypothetical protein
MNFHDENEEISSKLVLKEYFNDKKLRWQEMNEEMLASKSKEAFHLNKIVKSIFSKE